MTGIIPPTESVLCMGLSHFQHSVAPFLHKWMGTFCLPCIQEVQKSLDTRSNMLNIKCQLTFSHPIYFYRNPVHAKAKLYNDNKKSVV